MHLQIDLINNNSCVSHDVFPCPNLSATMSKEQQNSSRLYSLLYGTRRHQPNRRLERLKNEGYYVMYHESANIEIIRNTRASIKRSFDLVESASDEVLRIFSSINAFRRQARIGVLHLFYLQNIIYRTWCKNQSLDTC